MNHRRHMIPCNRKDIEPSRLDSWMLFCKPRCCESGEVHEIPFRSVAKVNIRTSSSDNARSGSAGGVVLLKWQKTASPWLYFFGPLFLLRKVETCNGRRGRLIGSLSIRHG